MRKTYPKRVKENEIRRMLPHNRIGSKIFKHLKVFAGQDHLHHAQQPKKLEM